MDINRNNYEEFFLLYADNELLNSEKEIVEAFVRENIDLKNEFLITQLTIVSPDKAIKLSDKSFLLKKETGFITENNYEEIFMLYHDDELSEQQKKETEKFAEQSLKFKKAFEWIGKSKLIPDMSVVHPIKNQLYKKERRAKIITLNWMKGIVAAVLIGFGIWLSFSYLKQSNINLRSGGLSKSIIKESVKEKSIEKKNSLLTLQDKKIDSVSDLNQIANSKNHENDFNKAEPKQELISIRKLKIKNQKSGNQIVKITPIKIQPDNNLQLVNSNETIEELPTNLTKMVKKLQNATVTKQQNEINSEAYNNSTVPTVYDNTINDGQNYVFYNISAEEFRKSKVGGFIKKIKRVVERNNPINR
ncbi:MAG: hypothetical protein ABI288_04875, partial [Ginsengibacter sp.]